MAEWQDTMERLVRDRERALLGYAYLVCGDPTRAQDLVQDALVRTFARERKGLTVFAAEGYVRRAITSVFIDEYRRSQRWDRVHSLCRHVGISPPELPKPGCRNAKRRLHPVEVWREWVWERWRVKPKCSPFTPDSS